MCKHNQGSLWADDISNFVLQQAENGLIKNGFKLISYDPCVANKKLNANQLTITWHVDEL